MESLGQKLAEIDYVNECRLQINNGKSYKSNDDDLVSNIQRV